MEEITDKRIVYAKVPKGSATVWLRCGDAEVERDGTINVRLDNVPLNGVLVIRPKGNDHPGVLR